MSNGINNPGETFDLQGVRGRSQHVLLHQVQQRGHDAVVGPLVVLPPAPKKLSHLTYQKFKESNITYFLSVLESQFTLSQNRSI